MRDLGNLLDEADLLVRGFGSQKFELRLLGILLLRRLDALDGGLRRLRPDRENPRLELVEFLASPLSVLGDRLTDRVECRKVEFLQGSELRGKGPRGVASEFAGNRAASEGPRIRRREGRRAEWHEFA